MSTMSTLNVVDGYTKVTKAIWRNPKDVAEMISYCEAHSHIAFLDSKGQSRVCKVNGKVRKWKRDANRCEIPVKYGLYEYDTFTESDIKRILIPVSEANS